MKTIEINLYKFEELSKEAKEKAISNFLNQEKEYFWINEGIESVREALKHFNFTLKEYSISPYSHSYIDIDSELNTDVDELSGTRLYKYLLNNNYLTYYCTYDKKTKDLLNGSCPYTGYCLDENFNDIIRRFISKPYNVTFFELMEEATDKVLKGIIEDMEYQDSEEFVISELIETGVDFAEDGEVY